MYNVTLWCFGASTVWCMHCLVHALFGGILYNGYRVFPEGKVRPGYAADHHLLVPRSGRVELYLYLPSGPYRACNGITLPYAFLLFSRKAISITHSKRVFLSLGMPHTVRMRDTAICGLTDPTIFSTLSHKRYNF